MPNVKLHLYGKADPAVGRKMGHLVALAETSEQSRKDVLAARDLIGSGASVGDHSAEAINAS